MQNMEDGMNKLMNEIREAQVRAGEQVVTNHLTDIGLAPLADDSAKYRLWDRSSLEFFTRVTEMQNRILKKKLAKHEEHGEALAMDLQFDIDVAFSRVPQPINVDVVMVMVQEFASTWSVVGGRFDDGTALERAEELKQAIRDMLTVDAGKASDEN